MNILQEHIASLDAELTNASREAAALRNDLKRLPYLEHQVQAARARIERLHDERITLERKHSVALQKLETARRQAERLSRLRDEHRAAVQRQSAFETLRHAFGKQGVQALIIETILPDIEEEANRLLNLMTNGRMWVRLNSQRTLTSGAVSETLDIIIGDEMGERPYEMYSGGEAFRVNFALRIALSRLLAHRAGARLQTLFIDEGFGSQDAVGRERLITALHAIKDEFARIFVITHIEELKDEFPARIMVEKNEHGSRVIIEGR